MIEAINTGVPGAIKDVLTKIGAVTAVRVLKNTAHLGRTPIMHAAVRGDLELFNEVLREMTSRLTKEEVKHARKPGWLVDRGFSRKHLATNKMGKYHASSVSVKLTSFMPPCFNQRVPPPSFDTILF